LLVFGTLFSGAGIVLQGHHRRACGSCFSYPCSSAARGDLQTIHAKWPRQIGCRPGLAICRRSVEANGGTLRVRDVPGSGCVFTIELPRHVSTKGAAEASQDPLKCASVQTRTPRSAQAACLIPVE
jgi:hypothetical protein